MKKLEDFEGEDLKQLKIDMGDYVKRMKKGKYGITVPKPFNFDIREKTRSKSIAEMRLERDIEIKRIEEENIIQKQFRHKPVPAAVSMPKYQSLQDKNALRREIVKMNSVAITKQKEAPFSFYEKDIQKKKAKLEKIEEDEREFRESNFQPQKAKPVPKSVTFPKYENMVTQDKARREKRIEDHAVKTFQKAALPPRMEAAKDRPKKKVEEETFSHKPQINELVTKEQFMEKQRKFNEKLDQTK